MLIFYCLLSSVLGLENPMAVAAKLSRQAQNENQAYSFLESLTTEVGPRMSGTPGAAAATEWGLKRLKSMGFDRVWSDEVSFPHWLRMEESASILTEIPYKMSVAALGNSGSTPEGGLEAEVLPIENYSDLAKLTPEECRGKIIYIGTRMKKNRNGDGYGEAVDIRSMGPSIATRLGAVAFLLRSIGTDDNRLAHTGNARLESLEQLLPAAAISNPDADHLEILLRKKQPVRIRLKLNCQQKGQGISHNLIAELTGREKPEEVVILAAHIDSWDYGTGALDDGAGMAIVSEAARLIGTLPQRPKRTIRVVFFACEENGLHGARAYAAKYANVVKHVVGAESDTGADRIYALASLMDPERRPLLESYWQALEPLGIARGDNQSGYGSDLRPLRQLGMPVISLLQDCTRYFDYHHTANDTLDKVDPSALNQNVAAWVVFAYLAAEQGDDFGRIAQSSE